MIVDLSKVPSPCRIILSNTYTSEKGSWGVILEETIRSRIINVIGIGATPQEAVDAAVSKFLGE